MSGGRLMAYLRVFGAVCALAAVFLFGMWLTWPEFPYNPSGFPIGRKFVAVSLNGDPLLRQDAPKQATLEVRGLFTFHHRVGGNALCNDWGGHATFLPARRIIWGKILRTGLACRSAADEWEQRYITALLTASRWRTEEGHLILENGTDVLRFQLAPP
jgi:heat shock protein HslJ